MKDIIIFGLGNNQEKYFKTRHNAGRLIVEMLAKQASCVFQRTNSYQYAKINQNSVNIWLVLSNGFMNESGMPLNDFLGYFKIDTKQAILVICQDDTDQISGRQKLAIAGGSAGHHGINSIYSHLKSWGFDPQSILRLKIGVRPVNNRQKSETFVLQNFSIEELNYINKFASQLFWPNLELLTGQIPKLQSLINTVKGDNKN